MAAKPMVSSDPARPGLTVMIKTTPREIATLVWIEAHRSGSPNRCRRAGDNRPLSAATAGPIAAIRRPLITAPTTAIRIMAAKEILIHAAPRQAVDVRRLIKVAAETSEVRPAKIISNDENDVRRRGNGAHRNNEAADDVNKKGLNHR